MADHVTDDEANGSPGRSVADRDQVDRRYAAALVALDAAAEPSPVVARSAAAAATDVVRLNEVWQHAGKQHSLIARLVTELGRLLPWRRRRLLGAMVASVNRNTETTRALIDTTQHFQSHVIWYAQTVAALAVSARRGDDHPESVQALHRAINAIGTDWLKHWEALAARDARSEARMAALTKAYDELREVANLAQQSTLSLKRVVEQSAQTTARSAAAPASPAGMEGPDPNAFKYVGFEDRFRGSREDVRQRLVPYLPLFAGATNVVDIGCGRGELLDLFREHGIGARGIDINDEMVDACRSRGLQADRADALAFLESQPDNSLGGVIAIQVVEHLEPGYLMRLIETAHHKLAPGAHLVLETINAACWAAFFDSYIRDFTHAHPIHPDTLKYLVQASGFGSTDLRFLAPVSEHEKLPTVKLPDEFGALDQTVIDLIETINAHADRLNNQLFTFRDFAVVARK